MSRAADTGPAKRAASRCTSAPTAASGRTRATNPGASTGAFARCAWRCKVDYYHCYCNYEGDKRESVIIITCPGKVLK
ncbi:hypothetical protein T492DRAFT_912638 [Pavlovales sp. CCMP2436]|nr:hypothetical protein T492DRAFT_912638 [Pavlovales sp. CCMP2436]